MGNPKFKDSGQFEFIEFERNDKIIKFLVGYSNNEIHQLQITTLGDEVKSIGTTTNDLGGTYDSENIRSNEILIKPKFIFKIGKFIGFFLEIQYLLIEGNGMEVLSFVTFKIYNDFSGIDYQDEDQVF